VTSRYAISALSGVSCAFAKIWVARLTHERLPARVTHPNGPPGWYCGSSVRGLAWQGGCSGPGARTFTWTALFKPVSPDANLRVYDVRVVGSGTVTYKSPPYGQATLHWVQTVLGLRVRILRPTLIGGARVVSLIAPRREGTSEVSADWSPVNPSGCAEHVTDSFAVHASAGVITPWTSNGITLVGGGPDCAGAPVVDGSGGPRRDGACEGGNVSTGKPVLSSRVSPSQPADHSTH
jgi:hypothetical protein